MVYQPIKEHKQTMKITTPNNHAIISPETKKIFMTADFVRRTQRDRGVSMRVLLLGKTVVKAVTKLYIYISKTRQQSSVMAKL